MIETQPECATEIEYVLEFFTDVLVPLAWPAVAIIGLVLFRSAIRDLLQRIVKAGPSGIEASPQLGNQSSKTLSSDAGDTFLSAAAKDKGLSPWLQKLEQYLKDNKIDDNIEAIKRVAASSDRRAHSEYVYRLIFGSQLQAIERMVGSPKTIEQLRDLYSKHKKDAGEHAFDDADTWMNFLLITGLVSISDGNYSLTDFGRSFYDILIQSGFSVHSKSF